MCIRDRYETDDPDDTGISKRYGKETFRKKGGFMHKLLEGIEDDLDDNLEDDLDDPEEDTDDREKEREKRKDHYRDADDEDIMLQKELAEEVLSLIHILSVSNSGNQCKCRHGFYDSGKLRFRKQTCKRNC